MIWGFCFKSSILVCNFFAAIKAFHIHILFRYDEIDNEWSKPHMLAHRSHTFNKFL